MSLVLGLGLEHSCPWPRDCLSSERLSLALASSSGGSRKFWWGGDFKHKILNIRRSSPKLRVIFRPKAEIQTFFRPKSGGLQKKKKKKRSSPKLRVIFRPKSEIQAFFSPKIRWSPKKKKNLPPIGLPTKMQNKENIMFLALLRLSFALD